MPKIDRGRSRSRSRSPSSSQNRDRSPSPSRNRDRSPSRSRTSDRGLHLARSLSHVCDDVDNEYNILVDDLRDSMVYGIGYAVALDNITTFITEKTSSSCFSTPEDHVQYALDLLKEAHGLGAPRDLPEDHRFTKKVNKVNNEGISRISSYLGAIAVSIASGSLNAVLFGQICSKIIDLANYLTGMSIMTIFSSIFNKALLMPGFIGSHHWLIGMFTLIVGTLSYRYTVFGNRLYGLMKGDISAIVAPRSPAEQTDSANNFYFSFKDWFINKLKGGTLNDRIKGLHSFVTGMTIENATQFATDLRKNMDEAISGLSTGRYHRRDNIVGLLLIHRKEAQELVTEFIVDLENIVNAVKEHPERTALTVALAAAAVYYYGSKGISKKFRKGKKTKGKGKSRGKGKGKRKSRGKKSRMRR